MRHFLSGTFIFLQITLFCQQKINVSFKYSDSYCGGARPTDDIVERYKKTHKLAMCKIKLSGKKTVLLTTDTSGHLTCGLKPGRYFIYLTDEKKQNITSNYDPSCAEMVQKSYGELYIQKNKVNYEVILNFPCSPCRPHNRP